MKSALAALTISIPLGFAGSALAGGHDQRSEHAQAAPGQQKKQERAAAGQPGHRPQPSPSPHPGAHRPSGDPVPRGDGPPERAAGQRRQRPSGRGRARGQARRQAAKSRRDAPRGGRPAAPGTIGKTTICHATGSAKKPYVRISVSNNALWAHGRHHDGRDIIPAPAGGCPAGSDEPGTGNDPTGGNEPDDRRDLREHGKTPICHATGSEENPYVVITVPGDMLDAHRAHGDIVPAPAGFCPGGSDRPTQDIRPDLDPLTDEPFRDRGRPPVLGVFTKGGAAPPKDGGVEPGTVRRESGTTAPAASGRLPFTGSEIGLILGLGLAGVAAGAALRRSSSRRAA